MTRPDLHYDLVRPGIAVYGLDPLGRPPEQTPLRPAMTFRTRVALVNFPNHANYCSPAFQGIAPALSCPDIILNSPTFGKILSASDPRIMQLALKFVF